MRSQKRYFNNVVLKNNELLKSDRPSVFDKLKGQSGALYRDFEDHKSMKTYEYAELQKKMYRENARRKRRFLIFFISILIAVLSIIIYFLFYYDTGPYHPLEFNP